MAMVKESLCLKKPGNQSIRMKQLLGQPFAGSLPYFELIHAILKLMHYIFFDTSVVVRETMHKR